MGKLANLIKNNVLLLFILLLFLFSRLYNISEIPASLYWDEASIGYNAYSVLKTGKDEWGEFLPLHFRAFGEFKLPVYIYSVLLAEIVFGVSQLAVRIPAVVFGLFSVLGLYLLVIKITKNKTISLLSSLLFSVSPWFFIFSRTGYEATAGLAFFIYAIYFLLLSQKKRWKIILSVTLFILSAYSYNSFRLLTLLFLGPYMIIFGLKAIKKKDKNGVLLLLLSVVLLLLSIVPIYKLYLRDAGLGRLQTVGISKNILTNYLANYSLSFLFSKGDPNPRSQIPGSPQLFPIDAVFILLGLVYIFKNKDRKYLFILIALVLAPIPAAITKEAPHALRSILMAPILATVAAMGIYFLLGYVKKYGKLALVVIVFIYLDFFGSYFYQFISRYNDLSSGDWQYPYKLIFQKYADTFDQYNQVYISDEYAQPYIFALFYGKTDPTYFVNSKQLNPVSDWGFSTVKSFGKFHFIKDCNSDFEKNSLVLCPI